MNRAENLRQADFVFPTYALLTWTPTTARFVKPFIYGFKGGYNVRAAEKLGTLFLSEQLLAGRKSVNVGPKGPQKDLLLSAPSERFDHSQLWAKTLSNQLDTESFSPFLNPSASTTRQKELRQAERGDRRFILKEHFANLPGELTDAKRTVFADDVITTGSTAMAAYMALGDPDQFEVWALVARPRLAGK
jgi:predicted amidophosphoribosyltransferase